MSPRIVTGHAALAAALILSCTPALAGPATDVVASIYAQPATEFDPAKRDLYTGAARTQLDRNDAILATGEFGCIDFGFAYDAQDYNEKEIARSLRFSEKVKGNDVTVIASFVNFRQPTEIEWDLRKIDGKWKIVDVASLTGGWRLSEFDCSM